MEGKQINYFSSPFKFEKIKASPPTSLPDKRHYIGLLSGRESKMYEDGAISAPSAWIFSKQFFEKIEADGADIAPSTYILDNIVSERNEEIDTVCHFPQFPSDIKYKGKLKN